VLPEEQQSAGDHMRLLAWNVIEQAALERAETLTRLPDGCAEREVEYQALLEHFNDEEIVELT
jgi:alkylhydroperoxidase family enzyme